VASTKKLHNKNNNRIFVQIENTIYNMHDLINRETKNKLLQYLDIFPAVAILGPRQCGKSTLAKMVAKEFNSFLYLDLQNRDDLAKMNEPALLFGANLEKTICIDEIQLMPNLFSILRSEIDKNRIKGRFLLLGSASRDLIKHCSESLAGRIGILELSPFLVSELESENIFINETYWNRGAYPDSYLAKTDEASYLWRESFIRTYIERDIPQLGFQIPSIHLMRMLTMAAHNHSQIFNASKLGESLGLTHPTVKRYLDLLEQTYILRRLQAYHVNIKKRLVKSPKVYVRDQGILHNLLRIKNFNSLLGNPIFGASWEGMVIENICSKFSDCSFYFYRTATGDEIDLIIENAGKIIAIECKASTAPKLNKGFWNAMKTLNPHKAYVVAPIKEKYPISNQVEACNLKEVIIELNKDLESENY
jgi:uncharacterized protein